MIDRKPLPKSFPRLLLSYIWALGIVDLLALVLSLLSGHLQGIPVPAIGLLLVAMSSGFAVTSLVLRSHASKADEWPWKLLMLLVVTGWMISLWKVNYGHFWIGSVNVFAGSVLARIWYKRNLKWAKNVLGSSIRALARRRVRNTKNTNKIAHSESFGNIEHEDNILRLNNVAHQKYCAGREFHDAALKTILLIVQILLLLVIPGCMAWMSSRVDLWGVHMIYLAEDGPKIEGIERGSFEKKFMQWSYINGELKRGLAPDDMWMTGAKFCEFDRSDGSGSIACFISEGGQYIRAVKSYSEVVSLGVPTRENISPKDYFGNIERVDSRERFDRIKLVLDWVFLVFAFASPILFFLVRNAAKKLC